MKKGFTPITTTASKTLIFFFYVSFCNIIIIFPTSSFAFVHFKTDYISLSFFDAPAPFAIPVNRSGICGPLHLADPLDACSSLRKSFGFEAEADQPRFALIERGNCPFEVKVKHAQAAGFQAAIVYDDADHRNLVSMIGSPEGIQVHAVFISKRAGEILSKFAQGEKGECCITPSSGGRAWTVLVISIFSLVIILSAFGMLLVARNHRTRRQQVTHHHSPHVNRRVVKGLPTVTFTTACRNDNRTATTCAICLEDYRDGESLRVLPCQHDFHVTCVDAWLTKWGTFCPVLALLQALTVAGLYEI
ncbi:hypothetical protein AAC387_Pa01g1070 [Persea americana]